MYAIRSYYEPGHVLRPSPVAADFQTDVITSYSIHYTKLYDGKLDLHPGERVRWRARLRRPTLFGTPGEFDYPRYLAARSIYVTSSLPHTDDMLHLTEDQNETIGFWERTRQNLRNNFV